jgi:hypothetical protein
MTGNKRPDHKDGMPDDVLCIVSHRFLKEREYFHQEQFVSPLFLFCFYFNSLWHPVNYQLVHLKISQTSLNQDVEFFLVRRAVGQNHSTT